MAYNCHEFRDGDILRAEQLNEIEDGIVALEKQIEETPSGGVSSWNDLTDKPFYEESGTETVFEPQTVTLSPSSAGWVAEAVASMAIVDGESYSVLWGDVEYSLTAGAISVDGSTGSYLGNLTFLGAGEDTGEPFFVGYLAFEQDGETVHALTIAGSTAEFGTDPSVTPTKNVAVYHNTTVIKKLDAKFLPAVSWNDLTDKPFGEEGGTEIILEEQTVDGFAYDSGYGFYGVGHAATFELVVGQTYKVIWEKSEYTCTAYAFASSGFTGVALGNESVMTGVSSDIVEPFAILYVTSSNYNSFFALDGSTDTSHTVAISQGTTVIKTLDAKFLPMNVIDERIEAYIGAALEGDY